MDFCIGSTGSQRSRAVFLGQTLLLSLTEMYDRRVVDRNSISQREVLI